MNLEAGWRRFEVATEYAAGFMLGYSIGREWHTVAVFMAAFLTGRLAGRTTAERIKRWRQSRRSRTSTH